MTETYYDQLAPYYRYIYQDWEASIKRQAGVIDEIIRATFGMAATVLDTACGIGTQAIGLAALGYDITASDISHEAVAAAQAEAARRNLDIRFATADMRRLDKTFRGEFEVVIALDNAIPHLLNDEDILSAFHQFYHFTKKGGGCLVSVRDYANMPRSGKQLHPRQIHQREEGQIILFDTWEFDGDHYEITTYMASDRNDGKVETQKFSGGRYYCIQIPAIEALLSKAGFRGVRTERDSFFQPLIIGEK